jgi:3-dehydroquinate synthase
MTVRLLVGHCPSLASVELPQIELSFVTYVPPLPSFQAAVDIEFTVPFTHRLRFTHRIAEEDFSVLADLFTSDATTRPKVLVVCESALLSEVEVISGLGRRLSKLHSIDLIRNTDGSSIHGMAGGESVKNSEQSLRRVLQWVQDHNLDRRSYIVVIGGGALLDAVGFAAAIAHRGIRLVRLPTTTLSQGDSGVGVKNAINYFGKKNWIGTFAVPWAVINDASLLASLSDRDFRCGFSEAVKVSLLKSRDDFEFLCRHASRIAARDMTYAFEAIGRSCRWHLEHITQGGDPFESFEARPLDFGHWSAHRLEPLTQYEIRHGEAVGIGVALDCLYSAAVHGFPQESAIQVCQCLQELGMPLWHDQLGEVDLMLRGLEEFRQHLGGRLTVTMLRDVADPIHVHEVNVDAMRRSIDRLHDYSICVS